MRLLIVLTLLVAAPARAQPVLYVKQDATGANNGTSWADAFTDLQSALRAGYLSAQIWVAAGTYHPDSEGDTTYQLRDRVAILGGFDGTETSADQRDPAGNATVLSGEDTLCPVVTATNVGRSAVLDGFTVTRSRGYCGPLGGAGLRITMGSPTVRNMLFVDNEGGAVLAHTNSHVLIENSVFRANRESDGGSALVIAFGSRATCTDCLFEGNVASPFGGAVRILRASALFFNSTFINNTASNGYGGAVWADRAELSVFVGCHFEANVAAAGGAIDSNLGPVVVVNSSFVRNRATFSAGALGLWDYGALGSLVANATFVDNRAPSGAAISVSTATADIRPSIVNSSIVGNRSTGGGAISVGGSHGRTNLFNSVVWGNDTVAGVPNEIQTAVYLQVDARNSIVRGGYPGIRVLDADPLVVRLPLSDGPQDPGDLRLLLGSPAIDLGDELLLPADSWDLDQDGDTTEVLPIDLAGGPRVQGESVDAGAYEGGVVVAAENGPLGGGAALAVAPNPASGEAVIAVTLAVPASVRLTLHDLLGREVLLLHEGTLDAGRHQLPLDTGALRPGVYFATLRATGISSNRRITVLR